MKITFFLPTDYGLPRHLTSDHLEELNCENFLLNINQLYNLCNKNDQEKNLRKFLVLSDNYNLYIHPRNISFASNKSKSIDNEQKNKNHMIKNTIYGKSYHLFHPQKGVYKININDYINAIYQLDCNIYVSLNYETYGNDIKNMKKLAYKSLNWLELCIKEHDIYKKKKKKKRT